MINDLFSVLLDDFRYEAHVDYDFTEDEQNLADENVAKGYKKMIDTITRRKIDRERPLGY